MVHFVGAGPGAPDLITLRGAEHLKKANVVIYAGSLVNPVLLGLCPSDCRIFNSAEMTLEQVLAAIDQAEGEGKDTVRLHSGDPCLYGAIQEQMDVLKAKNIPFDLTPGVSSFCGAAAAVERGRVRGVRGVGGGGRWSGVEGAGGARRRGGPDLARWDSDRDGGGSRSSVHEI